jgi:probable DNA metabolism protein
MGTMTVWLYDGTFDGLLSAVFELYNQQREKSNSVRIRKETDYMQGSQGLFDDVQILATVQAHADRVWAGLQKKLSPSAQQQLFSCYLSGQPDEEDQLLGFIRHVFANQQDVTQDYGNPFVLYISQQARKMHREKHRMEAFVRFQHAKDGLYYSIVEPDFNVLPLIAKHFKDRYADQRWLIYDKRRGYGIYYDLDTVETVSLDFSGATNGIWSPEEDIYQQLWQTYYKEANIASRKNAKLQLQHMPKKYWKYMVEHHGRKSV